MLFKKDGGSITKEAVLKALSHVDDPDLKKDLVTLKMIEDLKIKGKEVSFSVILTTPACPMKEHIHNACVNAIKLMVDKEAVVKINMTSRVTTQSQNQQLPKVKNFIAISSGKGGVGKSTVATNLAVSLALQGAKVGLIDADIYGPSIPIMMGCEEAGAQVAKVDGKDVLSPFLRHGVKVMSIGSIMPADKAVVWRGPMASKALRQLIFDTYWEEIDYLLVDMPPGTGDIHLSLVQALPVTGAVVVTTPQQVAMADARKGAEMFRMPQINVPLLGVIENMAYFTPEDAPDKKYYIFGEGGGKTLAEKLSSPLLGQIPIVESIARNSDSGKPISLQQDHPVAKAYFGLAQTLAQQIALRNAGMKPTEVVKITTG